MTGTAEALRGWQALLPEMVLAGAAMLVLLLDAAWPRLRPRVHGGLALLAVTGSAYLSVDRWDHEPGGVLGDMVAVDRFGATARLIILLAAGLALLAAPAHLRPRGLDRAEFYSLLLLSTAGMTLLCVSADLIMVFLTVELLSLAIYVLAGFDRERADSQEAAMKYFLLGAFSSAFLLYGIAFFYGASGTTNLLHIGSLVGSASVESFRLMAVATALILMGIGFKVALVPLHMWTPDAYQGAPTPVTAFMAGGTKTAAFAALVRILVGSLPELRWDWRPPLVVLAAVTIVFASVVAVAQTDVKRMLAYSSVAHAGFISLGVVAVSRTGIASVLFYLLVYTAMTVGAFGCIMLFREGAGERTHLGKLSGLGVRRPAAALLFAFFLFALAGIPPTGGFFAKFYVFLAAIRAGYPALAVLGVVASVVAAFFYVRVAVVMFMHEPLDPEDPMGLDRSVGLRVSLALCVLIVLMAGIMPGPLLELSESAVSFAREAVAGPAPAGQVQIPIP